MILRLEEVKSISLRRHLITFYDVVVVFVVGDREKFVKFVKKIGDNYYIQS